MSNEQRHIEQIIKLTNEDKLRWTFKELTNDGCAWIEAVYKGITMSINMVDHDDIYFTSSDGFDMCYCLHEHDPTDTLLDAVNTYIDRRVAVSLNLDKILFEDESKEVNRLSEAGQTEDGYFPIDSLYTHLKKHLTGYQVLAMIDGGSKPIVVPEEFASSNDHELIAVRVVVSPGTHIDVTWSEDEYTINADADRYSLFKLPTIKSKSVYDVLDLITRVYLDHLSNSSGKDVSINVDKP